MMRQHVAAFTLVGLLAAVAIGQHALAQDTADNTRRSMGNLRPGYPAADNLRRSMGNLRPNPPATQTPSRTILVVPQPYYGGYGYPYHRRYHPGGYGYYPAPYPYYHGPYVYPPIYMPPGTMYGPQALRRFMGVGW